MAEVGDYLPRLGIEELWRYALAGALLIFAYITSARQVDALIANGWLLAPLAVIALVAGSLLYVVHRNLVFPPLLLLALYIAKRKTRRTRVDHSPTAAAWPWGYPKIVRDLDKARWRGRALEVRNYRELGHWAAQIHFGYCCAIACVVGAFSALSTRGFAADWQIANLFLNGALVLLVATFRSNANYCIAELDEYETQWVNGWRPPP